MAFKALILAGPTASGKSDISLKIACEYFPDVFEIVSADSVQIYKYLDIGSGKLSLSDRSKVPHHMIDFITPDLSYSAGDYVIEAKKICAGISSRGKIPFFVGGTGLYLDAFFEGLSSAPETDSALRDQLSSRARRDGWDVLHAELASVDPLSASKIHPNDAQRILRALCVYIATGCTLSSFHGKKQSLVSSDTLFVAPDFDREILYGRINARVDAMIRSGLELEVRSLRENGYSRSLKSMGSIGYAQMNEFIDGELSLDDAVGKIKHDTRKYAKKQLIWFKKKDYIKWFNPEDEKNIISAIESWIDK